MIEKTHALYYLQLHTFYSWFWAQVKEEFLLSCIYDLFKCKWDIYVPLTIKCTSCDWNISCITITQLLHFVSFPFFADFIFSIFICHTIFIFCLWVGGCVHSAQLNGQNNLLFLSWCQCHCNVKLKGASVGNAQRYLPWTSFQGSSQECSLVDIHGEKRSFVERLRTGDNMQCPWKGGDFYEGFLTVHYWLCSTFGHCERRILIFM